MSLKLRENGLLSDSRVYLSGPMDFVASRKEEKAHGWRNRVGEFLRAMGVTVFDPWFKPEVRGLHEYGREGETTTQQRDKWTFAPDLEGVKARSALEEFFWPAMHIDLRMVDTSDFVVAYCPTNVYSVGTPHELVMARLEHKPVLFVSPRVVFPAYAELQRHLAHDTKGTDLLSKLADEVPIKENTDGSPSLWYMPLIGGENFFDGFGFEEFRSDFHWPRIRLDDAEEAHRPQKPLLAFLVEINSELPKKWSRIKQDFVVNDDWLLWNLKKDKRGAQVTNVNSAAPGDSK
jgi:hypothetical protein